MPPDTDTLLLSVVLALCFWAFCLAFGIGKIGG